MFRLFSLLLFLVCATNSFAAKYFDDVVVQDSLMVGSASAPNAAALVELRSTNQGFLLPRMTTAQRNAIPAIPDGLMIYNTDTNSVDVYSVASASFVPTTSGFSDPLTTFGDIIIRDGTNTTARLALGAASQVLTSNGSTPVWAAVPSGFADPMTTAGDLIYRDAGNATVRLAAGTASFVLTSDGVNIAWASIPYPADVGFADPMTTRGDVIYRDAGNSTARLAVGAASQVLTSDGTDLIWGTLPSGFADPMSTAGDLIYRNAGNATARLAVGVASFVLTSDGTNIAWASIPYPADVGFADPMSTAGDLIYRDAGNATARLAVGAASFVLTSDGTNMAWASIPYPADVGFADPLTTNGDLIVRAGGDTTRLPIGTASFVLTSDGTNVVWASVPSSGGGGGGSDWFASAFIRSSSGQVDISNAAEANYIEFTNANLTLTNASGAITSQIACASGTASTGTTCSSNESLGIAFTPTTSCAVKVCAQFARYQRCNGVCYSNAVFQIIETPNTSTTLTLLGGAAVWDLTDIRDGAGTDLTSPVHVCGIFDTVTAGVQKTYRLMYTKQLSSGSIQSESILADLAPLDANIHFYASCIGKL